MFIIEKSKIVFFMICLIGIISCHNESVKNNSISFDAKSRSFEKLFSIVDSFSIPTEYSDSIKIFEINKAYKINNDILLSDSRSGNLLIVSKKGELIKIIGKKGKGPGEFMNLSDFIVTSDRKILAINALENTLNEYHQEKFVKKIRLSFEHRIPEQILEISDNRFVICAYRNLENGSTRNNYNFLPYGKSCYLNIYDKEFNLQNGFISPHPKYDETMDCFAVTQINSFSPSVVSNDYIYSMRQDGFYEIIVSDMNGKSINRFSVKQQKFIEFDLNLIQDHKVINRRSNYSFEKQGQIIASHSSPTSLHAVKNYLLVTIFAPYDNAFSQYSLSDWPEREYHLDILK